MDWTRGRDIGRGTSATVSFATSRRSNEIFAVKSVELSKSNSLQKEQKILSKLNCPQIIGYKGYIISIENGTSLFNIMMDYAPGGTVADAINRLGQLDESMIGYYTYHILEGLKYLHSRGIVHCDIKGSNILLSESGAKIADFGCAKEAEEEVIGGTPMYMSPEVARGEEQKFLADIWALGCTVLEMFTGHPPWPSGCSTLRRIAFSGELPEFPTTLSKLSKDFLNKCLRIDPKERWTAEELLKHPFLDVKKDEESLIKSDCTYSPTSILDQGIWSSIEEECLHVSNDENLLVSPKQRMKELGMISGIENWELSDNWIKVKVKIGVGDLEMEMER
ncbi:hypothetical protein RD792_000111 [Penstemon davidsonii]|uniref:Protein kinase domain-containing protein n=1 Tax=Penstemon davidsonii TaxID=160366 RepID=A0ABR0DU83_9LAMI|nr:hypothetical protein RD792_000111 [Penstemon davidsonii]